MLTYYLGLWLNCTKRQDECCPSKLHAFQSVINRHIYLMKIFEKNRDYY